MSETRRLLRIGNFTWVLLVCGIFRTDFASGLDAISPPDQPVRIGVLAKRGSKHCLQRWTATADYLSEKIPGYSFSIRPLDFFDLEPAVNQQEVEFFLSNPSFYVALEKRSGAMRIATLKNLHIDGTSHKQFAGTLFCKASRTDLQQLPDLRKKTFMAVSEFSMGGWHMAWREFLERGIDPYQDFHALRFGGTHDAVVYAVLDGIVDAGTVRSDTLERMELEGKIRMADFKVLEPRIKTNGDIPFVHSTRHYPEWPLAKSAHTPDDLAELVARALIRMPTNSVAAITAKCGWWTIPYNYQPVHECLKSIRYAPYENYGKVSLHDFFLQYRLWLVGILILVIFIFLMEIYIVQMRPKLQQAILVKTERDRLISIFESMKDGVFILNRTHDIQYVNHTLIREFGSGIGKKCYAYFKGMTAPCASCLHDEVFDGKTAHSEYTSSENGKTYDVLYTPLSNADGTLSKLGIMRNITERKQMEMVLSHTNEVLTHSPIVVFRQKRGKRKGFEYMSDNVIDLLGYTAQDFMEEKIGYGEVVHPDDVKKAQKELATTLTDETAHVINYSPYRVITKNGVVKWIEDRTYIRRDAKGHITRFEGIISDITERREMEMALFQTNEIITRSPIVVFRRNYKDHEISEFISENTIHLTGYTAQEFIEKKVSYLNLIHPDDLAKQQQFDALAQTENKHSKLIEYEPYRIVTKSGEIKWVEDKTYIRRDSQGNITHNEGTLQDITARKKMEDERERILRDTAKRVQELRCMQAVEASINKHKTLEQAFEEIAGLIPDGWQYPKTACARIRFDGQEFISESFEETEWRQSAEIHIARQPAGKVEVFYLEKHPQANEGPFLSEERNLIDFIANALSKVLKHQLAEQEQEKIELILRQTQKMEAIGQLAGGVAHDFNNILQAMQGYTELILMNLEEGTKTHGFAEEVLKEAQRAAALTRQLLLFSRKDRIEKKKLELNGLIDNLLKMLIRILSENIDLQFNPSRQPLIIHGDSGQVEQIILNLCVNARDAMPKGGILELGTEDLLLDNDFCETHPWAKPGHYAVLTVSDSGCGMTKETLTRIFEPFFTTKEVSKGTGLGLATVYGIVNQHEGLIHVYSEVDKGTTFRIYIPCLQNGITQEKESTPPIIIGGQETILLVEDDESVRRVTTQILKAAGYTVLQACDGIEGIKQIEHFAKEIDLLISDIVMPGKTGVEVITCFHQHRPNGIVLLMSGYTGNVLDNFKIDDSINVAFIKKPFGSHELLRKVREQLTDKPNDS